LTAAPLARLAADAALPQSSVAIKVALPVAAAVADAPAVPLASPWQPTTPARARGVTEVAVPTDRREVRAGELLPSATDLTPAPPVAPLLTPTLAPHTDPLVPAAPASAAPADRIDFATLVDTIAQAREHAAPQSTSAPVSVSLAHADFGPVALRFRHDGEALAVTMASADPGFAPAVSAASQADAGSRAGQQQSDGQPRQHQPGDGQPTSGQSQSHNSASGSAGQGAPDQRQQGQTRSSAPTPAIRAAARATDTGESDPDIFA
jgi:Meckel syndrome type 1 protein